MMGKGVKNTREEGKFNIKIQKNMYPGKGKTTGAIFGLPRWLTISFCNI